jgi:hypothetical protein
MKMKKYSYNMFPIQLIVLGYILILISFIGIYIDFDKSLDKSIGYSIGFFFVGLIIVTFRSSIIIDSTSEYILKKSRMLGMILSKERVKIPKNCKGSVLKKKIKQGTGYYKAVIPMSYKVKSCDMFFYSDKGVVRLLNTDLKRATIIADLIKETLGLGYNIE